MAAGGMGGKGFREPGSGGAGENFSWFWFCKMLGGWDRFDAEFMQPGYWEGWKNFWFGFWCGLVKRGGTGDGAGGAKKFLLGMFSGLGIFPGVMVLVGLILWG